MIMSSMQEADVLASARQEARKKVKDLMTDYYTDHDAMQQELALARGKIRQLEEQNEVLRERNAALERQIATLRRQAALTSEPSDAELSQAFSRDNR